MSAHPRTADLHDLVLGFLAAPRRGEIRRHVEACPACRGGVRRIESERHAISGALAADPDEEGLAALKRRLRTAVPSGRPSTVAWSRRISIAAAAALLLSLGWWTWPDAAPTTPLAPGPQEAAGEAPLPRDPMLRFLTERLRGPAGLKREVAALALWAGGPEGRQVLGEVLEKEPALRSAIPTGVPKAATAEDQAVLKRLDTVVMEFGFEETKLSDILSFLGDFTMIPCKADEEVEGALVTVKGKMTLREALDAIIKAAGYEWRVENGTVRVGERDVNLAGSCLLRTPTYPARRKAAATLVPRLGSDEPGERQKSAEGLAALGTAAELELWKGLDDSDPEIRQQCASILGRLYVPEPGAAPAPRPSPALAKVLGLHVDFDVANLPGRDFLAMLHGDHQLDLVVVDPLDREISIKVRDIPIEALARIVGGFNDRVLVGHGSVAVYIRKDRLASALPPPRGALRVDASIVEDLEKALDLFAAGKDARLDEFLPSAIPALRMLGTKRAAAEADRLEAMVDGRYWFVDRPAPGAGTPLAKRVRIEARADWKLNELAAKVSAAVGMPVEVEGELRPADAGLDLLVGEAPANEILKAAGLAAGRPLVVKNGKAVFGPPAR